MPRTFVHSQSRQNSGHLLTVWVWLNKPRQRLYVQAENAHRQQGPRLRCACLPACLVELRTRHAAGPEPEINVNAQKLPRRHRASVPSRTSSSCLTHCFMAWLINLLTRSMATESKWRCQFGMTNNQSLRARSFFTD
jgi:hypothetical protein